MTGYVKQWYCAFLVAILCRVNIIIGIIVNMNFVGFFSFFFSGCFFVYLCLIVVIHTLVLVSRVEHLKKNHCHALTAD